MNEPASGIERRAERDALLEATLRSVSDGIFLLDASGRFVLVNEAVTRMADGEARAWTGVRAGVRLPKPKRREGLEAFVRALGGREQQLGIRVPAGDGSGRDLSVALKPLRWQGAPHVLGVVRDVTAAREARELAMVSRVSLESILRAAPTGIAWIQERVLRWVSGHFAEMLGDDQSNLTGLEESRLYETREEYERVGRLVAEEMRTQRTAETDTRWKHRDGRIIDVHLRSTLLDPQRPSHGRIVSAVDITDRKRNQEDVERRRMYLEAVLRDAPDAIITLDPQHRIIEWNPAAEDIFLYTQQEAAGKHPDDLIASDRVSEEAEELTRRVLRGKKVSPRETVRFRKDGTPVHVILSGSPIMIGDRLQGIVAIYTDVSDRRAAETALRRSEERYRSLVENAPIGIVSVDRDGAIRNLNPTFFQLLDAQKDPLGESLFHLPPFDQSEVAESFRRVMDQGTGGVFEATLDGGEEAQTLRYHVTPICDAEGEVIGAQGMVEDISEGRRLELQLQQAQKLEAIGTLAGGIAHDFNNLLMGIQGRVSIMLMESPSSHPHHEQLKGIEEHTRSATELTRQLLGFASRRSVETRPTDLNDVLEKSAAMFGRTRKEIRIHTNPRKGLPLVETDAGQIEQVLLNLYVNAWQAMPGGGDLYLSTGVVDLQPATARTLSVRPGRFVRISVRDTGIGMDESTQQRIFDPFFTTKQKNRGTGLGLSSAYGIVTNHGGAIQVRSRTGEGTRFHIYLPASGSTPHADPAGDSSQVQRGSETILLVDDEDMVLEVGRALLQHLGYLVLVARGGREAVDLYRQEGGRIDLVVLDMIMPGMGGGAAFDALREMDPGVRVLLSSGYSEEEGARDILERGCCGFIQKPFDLPTFSEKLRSILDGPTTSSPVGTE